MSDRDEKNTKLVVLQAIPNHQNLVKVNRWLLFTVFFLMSVIVIGGLFLFPDKDLTDYKKLDSTKANSTQTNPALSAEVNVLKGQFVGLVSGSIESKLRTLEESVRLGTSLDSLLTIEDLRNDIKALRAYSDAPNNEIKAAAVHNEQLVEEMSDLKRLVYLSLASCGLMLVAVVGIWVKNRHRLPYKEIMTRYLHKD
jgi:cell division protein FtsB